MSIHLLSRAAGRPHAASPNAARAFLARLAVVCIVVIGACAPAVDEPVPDAAESPPGGAGGELVSGTTIALDGVRLAYDVRGQGETALVFVHCWACNRDFWRGQLDAFADEYRVVSLDLAGHGESGIDRTEWTIAGYGGDVQAVIGELGLDRVILIGHSMGGPVALEAARLMPDRVIGVACVDTLHDAEQQMSDEQAEQMMAALEADFAGTMRAFGSGAFPEGTDPAVVEFVVSEASAADPDVAIALANDFRNFDMRHALAAVEVPIRCVNAEPNPPNVPVTAVETNRNYADFDAVIMESVGHFLLLEKPAEFNALLRQVVAELDAR